MDAKERAVEIAIAALGFRGDEMWAELTPLAREYQTAACASAVSRAYEIDGVMELVEAAEGAAASLDSEIGPRYKFPDGHIHPAQQKQYDADVEEVATIRAAAARVREAIAAQADEPKEDR